MRVRLLRIALAFGCFTSVILGHRLHSGSARYGDLRGFANGISPTRALPWNVHPSLVFHNAAPRTSLSTFTSGVRERDMRMHLEGPDSAKHQRRVSMQINAADTTRVPVDEDSVDSLSKQDVKVDARDVVADLKDDNVTIAFPTNSTEDYMMEEQSGNISNDVVLNIDEVLDRLKVDLQKILLKEPQWSIYADDFFVKLSLESIGIFRLLGGLRFILQEDTVTDLSKVAANPRVAVRWKVQFVQFERKLNFIEKLFRALNGLEFEPVVSLEVILNFNDRNQVSYMDVQKLEVDGRTTQTWPKLEIKCNPADVWRKVSTAVRDARPKQLRKTIRGSLWDIKSAVESDINQFFYKEPNWAYFAKNFYIKAPVQAISFFKAVALLLKDDIMTNSGNMTLVLRSYTPGRFYFEKDFDAFLRAPWKVQLPRQLNQFEQTFRSVSFALSGQTNTDTEFITLEGENVFHFNKFNQIDYMSIENLVVDGYRVIKWPVDKIQKKPQKVYAKLRKFIKIDAEADPLKKIETILGMVDLSDLVGSVFPFQVDGPRDTDLKRVVEKLKVDISQAFRKEPNWDIFTDDFFVRISLEGGEILKVIEKRLLAQGSKVFLDNDIPIRFIYDDKSEPFLVARWEFRYRKLNRFEMLARVLYDRWRNPFSSRREIPESVGFQCETFFHFNERSQVDYMRIDNLVVDGFKRASFGTYKISENPATILKRVKSFVNDAQQSEPLNLRDDWSSISNVDLNAGEIVKRWTQKAKKGSTEGDRLSASDVAQQKRQKKMDGSVEILDQLKNDLVLASPDKVIILSVAQNKISQQQMLRLLGIFEGDKSVYNGAFSVFAVATANEEYIYDGDGRLQEVGESLGLEDLELDSSGRVPVIKVDQVAALPTKGGYGFGEQLLFQIIRSAAKSGRVTVLSPANEKLEQYYSRLGFEKIDEFDRDMVYNKPLPEVSDEFEMFLINGVRSMFDDLFEKWDPTDLSSASEQTSLKS